MRKMKLALFAFMIAMMTSVPIAQAVSVIPDLHHTLRLSSAQPGNTILPDLDTTLRHLVPHKTLSQAASIPAPLQGKGKIQLEMDRSLVLAGIQPFHQVTVTIQYSVQGAATIVANIPEGSTASNLNGGKVKDNQITWTIPSKNSGSYSYSLTFGKPVSKTGSVSQNILFRSQLLPEASEWKSSTDAYLTVLNPGAQLEDRPGYVYGFPDRTFRPDQSLTRAQGVSLIVRLLYPNGEYKKSAIKQTFTDVRVDPKLSANEHWAAKEIAKGVAEGLVSGYTDGTFRPEKPMSRGEYLLMLARALNKNPRQVVSIPYTDVKGDSLKAAVSILQQLNALKGFPDGTLRPNLNVTRKEVVAITNKVIVRFPLNRNSKASYTDVRPGDWYYGDVEAASTNSKYLRIPSSFNPLEGVGRLLSN